MFQSLVDRKHPKGQKTTSDDEREKKEACAKLGIRLRPAAPPSAVAVSVAVSVAACEPRSSAGPCRSRVGGV